MIKIYSKTGCIQCRMTKQFLDENNLQFEEIKIDSNNLVLNELKQQGIKQLPVVFFNNKILAIGFQPWELKKLIK